MVESWLFIFAVIAVLLIPGPTNALLASSVHFYGFLKTFLYVPVVLFGYGYGMSLWALLIYLTMPIWPNLIHILHAVSAVYVIWLAFHLWKKTSLLQQSHQDRELSCARLFKSSLKNPKSLLLAVGILPHWTWASVDNYIWVMGIFSMCLIPCAMFWMYVGGQILAGKVRLNLADRLYKGSAMLLMVSMLPIVIRFF